mmetsp:Transcript_25453/g.36987  ORF Transcript_25453/g.36987 Transcript_25453/m.36987 type:complete len:249 (-) Transcript_25453:1384-2130(-)
MVQSETLLQSTQTSYNGTLQNGHFSGCIFRRHHHFLHTTHLGFYICNFLLCTGSEWVTLYQFQTKTCIRCSRDHTRNKLAIAQLYTTCISHVAAMVEIFTNLTAGPRYTTTLAVLGRCSEISHRISRNIVWYESSRKITIQLVDCRLYHGYYLPNRMGYRHGLGIIRVSTHTTIISFLLPVVYHFSILTHTIYTIDTTTYQSIVQNNIHLSLHLLYQYHISIYMDVVFYTCLSSFSTVRYNSTNLFQR